MVTAGLGARAGRGQLVLHPVLLGALGDRRQLGAVRKMRGAPGGNAVIRHGRGRSRRRILTLPTGRLARAPRIPDQGGELAGVVIPAWYVTVAVSAP
jgi:hypothetical protein